MAKDPLTGQPIPWNDLHRQYIDGSVDGDLPMTRLSEMFNVNHFIVSQVNPHVVPFLPKEDGPTNGSEQGSSFLPRWVNTMTHLAKDEVLHRISTLSELGVFPTSMTKFACIMNQKYSGDITIYPQLNPSDIPRMLENPTTEFMLQACLSGERATWPRLSRIRNHCAIELALDEAIQQMRARVTFSPAQVKLRLHSSAHPSANSADSNTKRGRVRNRRRSSYSHELERRGSDRSAAGQSTRELRKARSTVSLENPPTTSNDLISVPARQRSHVRRSSISFGDGTWTVDSGSEEELGLPLPSVGRPWPFRYRASWDSASSQEAILAQGMGSPVRSRRSSFSGRLQRSPSNRRGSPKQAYSPSAREISMALSPSSRHLLSMTPTVQASSSDQSVPTQRHGKV